MTNYSDIYGIDPIDPTQPSTTAQINPAADREFAKQQKRLDTLAKASQTDKKQTTDSTRPQLAPPVQQEQTTDQPFQKTAQAGDEITTLKQLFNGTDGVAVGHGMKMPKELYQNLKQSVGSDFQTIGNLLQQDLVPEMVQALETFLTNAAQVDQAEGLSKLAAVANRSQTTPAQPTVTTPTPEVQKQAVAQFKADGSLPQPQKVDSATTPDFQKLQYLSNASSWVQTVENMINLSVKALPDDDPQQLPLTDFLKFVAAVIQDAKEFLRLIQEQDSVNGRKNIEAAKEAAVNKIQKAHEAYVKAQEAKEKQEKFGLAMKIIGPVLFVLSTVATVLDGGTTVGLMAFSIGMMTMSTVDTATGGHIMGAVGGLVQKMEKALENDLPPEVAKVLTAVIVIAIVIAVALATRGAASKLGAEEGTANIIAFQSATLATTASQAVIVILRPILEKMIHNKDDLEMVLKIIQELVQILMSILAMKMAGSSAPDNLVTRLKAQFTDIEKSIDAYAEGLAKSATRMGNMIKVGSSVTGAVSETKQGQLRGEKSGLDADIKQLETFLAVSATERKSMDKDVENFSQLYQLFANLFLQILEGSQQSVDGAVQA